MESYCVLWDPKSWLVVNQGESSVVKGDLIYQMMIGEGEDEHRLHYSYIEYVSKTVYDKIVDGTYDLVKFPNSDTKVLLFDENGELISLVNGAKVNDWAIDDDQLEYINKRKNEASLKLEKKQD